MPNNQPMYSVFRTHKAIENFRCDLRAYNEYHPILKSLWAFYQEKRFLTPKQCYLALKILNELEIKFKRARKERLEKGLPV